MRIGSPLPLAVNFHLFFLRFIFKLRKEQSEKWDWAEAFHRGIPYLRMHRFGRAILCIPNWRPAIRMFTYSNAHSAESKKAEIRLMYSMRQGNGRISLAFCKEKNSLNIDVQHKSFEDPCRSDKKKPSPFPLRTHKLEAAIAVSYMPTKLIVSHSITLRVSRILGIFGRNQGTFQFAITCIHNPITYERALLPFTNATAIILRLLLSMPQTAFCSPFFIP